MHSILVLRGGALGDFIVTLPALAGLRATWPAARIELIGNATAAQLARNRGLIDAAYSQHESRWSVLYGDASLPEPMAGWLAGFDLVINYWPDPEGELRRRFPVRAAQTWVSIDAIPMEAPAAVHYARPLGQLGVSIDPPFHPLRPHGLATAKASPLAGRTVIAVHPGSGSPRKNWPLPRWGEICAWLTQEQQAQILVVTGEAEPAGVLADCVHRAHHRPLEELVAELSSCRLFLGHDSGVSHLAAACGVPCVLLFGPTDPAMWAPPASHVRVIRRNADVAAITVEEVRGAIAGALRTPVG
jgi:heptosyltransferase III